MSFEERYELYPLLNTLSQLQSKIRYPGCEKLYDKWFHMRTDDAAGNERTEMEVDVTKFLRAWCKVTEEKEIVRTLATVSEKAMFTLHKLSPFQFKGFFQPKYTGLPVDFAAPTPFLVINRNEGQWIPLKKPLILRYGNTKIKIMGSALKSEDGQLTFALLSLSKRKIRKRPDNTVAYRTTLSEIGIEMMKGNPYAQDTQNAIWHGLERLRACAITITGPDGLRSLGGILNSAKELKTDESGEEIDIYLDRDFVELVEIGYTKIDPKLYFKMPPRQANLYLYLQRQMLFNTKGRLKAVSIEKVYIAAGMGGLTSDNKSSREMENELRQTLEKLVTKKIVKSFSLLDGNLSIPGKNVKELLAGIGGQGRI